MTTPQKVPTEKIDPRDVFFFGGLVLAAIGGVFLSAPWTLVVIGAVLAFKANGPIVIVRRAPKEAE